MDEDLLVNNNDTINTVVNILFIRVYVNSTNRNCNSITNYLDL